MLFVIVVVVIVIGIRCWLLFAGRELSEAVGYYYESWLPAREIVKVRCCYQTQHTTQHSFCDTLHAQLGRNTEAARGARVGRNRGAARVHRLEGPLAVCVIASCIVVVMLCCAESPVRAGARAARGAAHQVHALRRRIQAVVCAYVFIYLSGYC